MLLWYAFFLNYIPQFQLLFTIKYVKVFPLWKNKTTSISIYMLITIFDYFFLHIYRNQNNKGIHFIISTSRGNTLEYKSSFHNTLLRESMNFTATTGRDICILFSNISERDVISFVRAYHHHPFIIESKDPFCKLSFTFKTEYCSNFSRRLW